MPVTKEVFYTESLSCNCPECYSRSGLELTFNQEWRENAFSKKATPLVREELVCKQCDEVIYPINWTEDIERLYDYHLKRATPSTYFKRKVLFWVLIIAIILLVVTGTFFMIITGLH